MTQRVRITIDVEVEDMDDDKASDLAQEIADEIELNGDVYNVGSITHAEVIEAVSR